MQKHPSPRRALSRRDFLKNTGLASGLLILPSGFLRGENAPSNRINVAGVGVTGMGRDDINGARNAGGTLIGICDVESSYLAGAQHAYPEARAFADYREMFDKIGKDIDAVLVSTPDHTHFTVAMTAVQLGKHVHVQKPLCRTVDQVRRLTKAAAEHKIVSQMGNQGHSNAHIRLVKEWYEAGLFGEINRIDTWTAQPLTKSKREGTDAYLPVKPVPKNLNWDLWLGPAASRPYSEGLAPRQWRAYYDFGGGSLGDMAAHIFDAAYYVLDLGAPERIEFVEASSKSPITFPERCRLVYHFPANAKRGPVKLAWSQGRGSSVKPPVPEGLHLPDGSGLARRQSDGLTMSGSLFYGEKLTFNMGQYGDFFYTVPVERFAALKEKAPPQKYPRVKGSHYRNWLDAIRNGGKATSDFSYAGPLTEVIQLGVIAQRVGRSLNWDAKAGKFIGDDEANALLVAAPARDGFLA
ncbi:MAG: Gfo/Idh/MocA family oxidoreductase [Puniceicoccales bacterium]|jgi:predicted dehydrogenase|nr:Gfo/Idh/MocA family oxidoreductase [Puniceicoccales bacterium]